MTDTERDIESDTLLEDVEHHFRVWAGPGAGKTHWLVGHIKNALHKTERITPASRLACISYTNVAVNEIRKRLEAAADRVDTSTIHSFLYRNVVKPYLHLLEDGRGRSLVNYADVDGHYEHRPSKGKVKDWLDAVGNRSWTLLIKDWPALSKCLQKLIWTRSEHTGCWSLDLLPKTARPKYFPTTKLNDYKPFYWKDGTIDHEDVLYFAHRILEEHPLIREFLSARFPYIFVDEFQDTNPVQTQVVKWLAESGSVVGVIGDPEQSIYGFLGARRDDFVGFSLPGLTKYRIKGNRRSTSPIVDLLNRVRTDEFAQSPLREIDGVLVRTVAGEPVGVIVGEPARAIDHARNHLLDGTELHVLARYNDDVARLRTQTGAPPGDTWARFQETDYMRARFFEHLVTGVEAARVGSFTPALKELLRVLRVRNGQVHKPLRCQHAVHQLQVRGIAVSLLNTMLTEYAHIGSSTLMDVYSQVNSALDLLVPGLSLTGVRPGKFKEFAEATSYNDLAASIRLPDETRTVRTMHSAKGAQFANVLVWLGEGTESRLGHILNAHNPQDEERRVTYVALSRAQDRLVLSVPSLTDDEERQLKELGVEVERVS